MITPSQFHEAHGVEDWRVVGDGACTFFGTDSFAQAAGLVQAIGELPGVEEHRPDVDLRPDGVTIRLITVTEDAYGMSDDDVELARQISTTARDLGLSGDPAAVQSVLVIPGASDPAEVMPFWQAVLGYQRRNDTPDEDLVDPRGRGSAFWFEPMDELRADGGGAIHVTVWVPPRKERRGSPRRSRRVDGWCATSSPRRGGPWPTPRGTRRTLQPPRAAIEGGPADRHAARIDIP